jgi:hypothetical protein
MNANNSSLLFIYIFWLFDEIGLLGQTRAEKQGDFKDNCNVQEGLLFYHPRTFLISR